MIPKIIHQTWKTTDIPAEYKQWVNSWKKYNPDYQYRLWTDDDNRNLIKEYFPDHLHFYDSLPLKIHRIDVIRYFILFKYGGVYVDLDFECFKSITPLLDGHQLVLASEPKQHCENLYNNRPHLMCNAWMASSPDNPFWIAVIQEINKRANTINSVLELTGPILLDDVYNNVICSSLHKIHVAESDLIYPIYGNHVKNYDRIKKAYCAHQWKNSWTSQTIIPKQYDGFYFYPTFDSILNDIHTAKSLDDAYNFAISNNAIAFNTDNYVKSSIENLKPCWTDNSRGIYIKFDNTIILDNYNKLVDVDISSTDICKFIVKDIRHLSKIADENPWCIGFNGNGNLLFGNPIIIPKIGSIIYLKKNVIIPINIIEGFDFYPYRDSPFSDLYKSPIQLTKSLTNILLTNPLNYMILDNIKQLAEECRNNKDAVAFNLDGCVKKEIKPIEQFEKSAIYRHQGIFVKK